VEGARSENLPRTYIFSILHVKLYTLICTDLYTSGGTTMPEMRGTIQVAPEIKERLRAIAGERHESIGDAVAYLVELEEDRRWWTDFDAGYNALRNDPAAWAEEQHERALLETTLMDGLKDE